MTCTMELYDAVGVGDTNSTCFVLARGFTVPQFLNFDQRPI